METTDNKKPRTATKRTRVRRSTLAKERRREVEDWMKKELEIRAKLIIRIIQLGGKVPAPWAHDDTGQYRNLQLLELVEELEKQQKAINTGEQELELK